PWIVDTTIPIYCIVFLPSSRLCGESDLTMTKLSVFVTVGRPSSNMISRARNLVEHLSMDLPSTYKGLMEKTYTWIKVREVATNGAPNDHRDNFERSRKSYRDKGKGQKSRDRFSP
nr:hypothetical protein [Tanacetum cinerariifolium]